MSGVKLLSKSKSKEHHPSNQSTSSAGYSGVQKASKSSGSRWGAFYSAGPVLSLGGPVQAKMKIGHSGDPYEREADSVAERIMSGGRVSSISGISLGDAGSVVQRQEEEEEKEDEELIQAKNVLGHDAKTTPSVESHILAMKGSGEPLPESTRAYFEPRFGHDFSQVRVHTDAKAAEAARAVNALAYTTGRDVVFEMGQYSPGTRKGRQLLAHELVHVVQQGSNPGPQTHLTIGDVDDLMEHKAETVAKTIVRDHTAIGNALAIEPATTLGIVQRLVDPATTPAMEVAARELARKSLSRAARRAGWRHFWRVVVKRFALRGAVAVGLMAVDGPLPIGDLIAIGLAIWTIWEIIELWDVLWRDAEGLSSQETQPVPQTHAETDTQTETRNRERRRDCFRIHPHALICDDFRDRDEVAVEFLMNKGYNFDDLGDCWEVDSFGVDTIDACNGAPGQRWHCRVNGTTDEISIFGCLCCNEDGSSGYEWRVAHVSVDLSRRR